MTKRPRGRPAALMAAAMFALSLDFALLLSVDLQVSDHVVGHRNFGVCEEMEGQGGTVRHEPAVIFVWF